MASFIRKEVFEQSDKEHVLLISFIQMNENPTLFHSIFNFIKSFHSRSK